jgi:hypothetical protein
LVAADTCRFCDVKQLCSEYWESGGRARLAEGEPPPVRALEIEVGARLGQRSWSARITSDPWLESGSEAILIGSATVEFPQGSRLRVIDCRVESPAQEPSHVYLVPSTEVFWLKGQPGAEP